MAATISQKSKSRLLTSCRRTAIHCPIGMTESAISQNALNNSMLASSTVSRRCRQKFWTSHSSRLEQQRNFEMATQTSSSFRLCERSTTSCSSDARSVEHFPFYLFLVRSTGDPSTIFFVSAQTMESCSLKGRSSKAVISQGQNQAVPERPTWPIVELVGDLSAQTDGECRMSERIA